MSHRILPIGSGCFCISRVQERTTGRTGDSERERTETKAQSAIKTCLREASSAIDDKDTSNFGSALVRTPNSGYSTIIHNFDARSVSPYFSSTCSMFSSAGAAGKK